jgi:hypothetical protein
MQNRLWFSKVIWNAVEEDNWRLTIPSQMTVHGQEFAGSLWKVVRLAGPIHAAAALDGRASVLCDLRRLMPTC